MENLSKNEIKIISDLEFRQKYFFTRDDIRKHFDTDTKVTKTIYHLRRKGRIEKLNSFKYYLIPIKARTGRWTENPYIIADEIFNGKDYFIGGWAAAHYWGLTDQVPMQFDIWTTRRQGKTKILGVRFNFHRTTTRRIKKAVIKHVGNHPFRIQDFESTRKWFKK